MSELQQAQDRLTAARKQHGELLAQARIDKQAKQEAGKLYRELCTQCIKTREFLGYIPEDLQAQVLQAGLLYAEHQHYRDATRYDIEKSNHNLFLLKAQVRHLMLVHHD